MRNRPSISTRLIAAARAATPWALVAGFGWATPARADDVSPPALLQDFESTWQSITNKMPDVFAAGYGGVYTPPPSRAESGNQSVGYDVYDRFDLGSAGNPTLYGTANGLKQMVSAIHGFGGNSYIDLVWNHDGFADAGTSGFAAAGGYPGFALTLQTTNASSPGYNTRGYNAVDGDFHSAYDTSTTGERLAGLIDIDQSTNYSFIRNPTVAGNPLNIPGPVAGATAADNHPLANVPTASNAQFYPSYGTTPQTLYDPTLGQTFTRYQFDNANPLNGTPVAENAQGYLERYAQYLVQVVGTDGFRVDAAKNMPTSVLNYLDLATYDASNRFLLNGQRESVFSWSEVFDSSPSLLQSYINKSATGTDTGNSGTVGGNRDVYDFPLYFAMSSNLTGTTANNNWYNVVGSSIDANDDGLLNGSQGVKFVQSQDSPAPALSSVAYAYTLMQPGNALVYFNGHNFGTESQRTFPQDGRGDALGGTYGTAITTLVDLRNRFGRGNYATDYISTNQLAFERAGSSLTLLSNVTEGGYDSRTVDVSFAAGTPLLEYTGNAASTNATDPGAQIPQLLIVNADSSSPTGASVNVRFLRNSTYVGGTTSTFLGNGYLVYGLPTPTGSLKLTNVASTFGNNAPSASDSNVAYENGTQLNSTVDVVKTATFQVQLSTNIAYLLGTYRDHDSDGDNAVLKVDGGVDVSGSGLVTDPSNAVYGFGQFVTVHTPGYSANNGAGGNGSYAQTINVSQLGQGYHYITVDAFRHRDDGGPAVYTDWKQTVYVDTAPPNSTITGFPAAVAGTNENRDLNVTSVDGLANSVQTFLDLPFGLTDAQVLAMVGSGGQANQLDVASYQHYYSGVTSGNHTATVVSYKPDGTYNIQRFASAAYPFLTTSTAFGAGLGDLNADGTVNATDVTQFQTVLQSNNTQFNAAADINGDGYVDLADTFLLGPVLVAHSATSAFGAYSTLVNSAYVTAGAYSVVGTNVIYDDTAGSTTVTAGSALTAAWVRGGSLALATGSTVKLATTSSFFPAATSSVTGLTLTGSAGAWTSRLDVGTQTVIVGSTTATAAADLARLTSMAAQAYDGGKLDGQGIGTSTVDGQHAVAVIPNVNPTTGAALYTTVGGQAVAASSILVGYAAYGDTDLSGTYDSSDLARMNNGFINHGSGWVNGDFNYDGVVDGRDYALVTNPIRQTTYWTGGSVLTSNWSDGKNWSTGTPPPYDTIVFSAAVRTVVNNDLTAANQHVVQFNATAPYTITGNGLTLYDYAGQQSKIENQGAGAATVDLPVTFAAGTGANVAEINAVNGDLSFTANGTVALTGAAVASLQLYGSGHTVTFNGVISGAGRFVQVNGTDVVNLNAANTYSGGTNIYSGTVRANATAATGAGPVYVNAAGTLGGSGSVTGAVTINPAATVTAGSSATAIGTLTTGAETWDGGGTLLDKVIAGPVVAAVPGTTNDELVLSGLTLNTTSGNPFAVSLASLGVTTTLVPGTVLTLAKTAAGTFDLSQLTLSASPTVSAPTGFKIALADAPSGGGDTLYADVVVATPEPTSLGLLAAAAIPFAGRRRQKSIVRLNTSPAARRDATEK